MTSRPLGGIGLVGHPSMLSHRLAAASELPSDGERIDTGGAGWFYIWQ